jgi:hypothetical protein
VTPQASAARPKCRSLASASNSSSLSIKKKAPWKSVICRHKYHGRRRTNTSKVGSDAYDFGLIGFSYRLISGTYHVSRPKHGRGLLMFQISSKAITAFVQVASPSRRIPPSEWRNTLRYFVPKPPPFVMSGTEHSLARLACCAYLCLIQHRPIEWPSPRCARD